MIEIALEEADKRNSSYLGGEHLFWGILAEEGDVAASILRTMVGKELDRVRNNIMAKFTL